MENKAYFMCVVHTHIYIFTLMAAHMGVSIEGRVDLRYLPSSLYCL